MTKQEFLARLEQGLSGLPRREAAERVSFYSEMIDDRMEEGLSEEEAVRQVGPVEGIIAQITGDVPGEKVHRRQLEGWQIVLLVLGFPVWLPLLIAGGSVAFSLYVVLWSVAVSLWSVFAAFAGSAVGCVLAGIIFALVNSGPTGLTVIASGLICAGLAIFSFFGCWELTKTVGRFTKWSVLGIKNFFVRRVMGK